MKTIPPLPNESFRLTWSDARAAYYVDKPRIGDTDVYTKEQVEDYGIKCGNEAIEDAAAILFDLADKNPAMKIVWLGIAQKILELK